MFHAEKYSGLYAFHYKPKEGELVKQSSGWALFDSQNEYSRMGVPNELWRSTSLNSEYEVYTCCFFVYHMCAIFMYSSPQTFPLAYNKKAHKYKC